MPLFRGLRRKQPTREDYYVHDGVGLTRNLVKTLSLPGWHDERPVLTAEENAAVQAKLIQFRQEMSSMPGYEALLSSKEFSEIGTRHLTAEALEQMASDQWRGRPSLPEDWRCVASTYLKAWAVKLNPSVLIDLARLLMWAGYRSEAKQALVVVDAWFPWYAPRYWPSGVDQEVLAIIMANAKELLRKLEQE